MQSSGHKRHRRKRWTSISQGEKKPTLLKLSTCGHKDYEKITFCCLSHAVCGALYWQTYTADDSHLCSLSSNFSPKLYMHITVNLTITHECLLGPLTFTWAPKICHPKPSFIERTFTVDWRLSFEQIEIFWVGLGLGSRGRALAQVPEFKL
jgi:hypothetical protein